MITVTGSEGFIGQHVQEVLRERKLTYNKLDRKLGNELTDLRCVDFGHSDAVIHLAAHADVRYSWENYQAIQRDNVEATLATLDLAVAVGAKTFVFISTGAVYAGSTGFVTEETPCLATSPYAASKLAGEAYVQAYAARWNWRWYVLRPASCFGRFYHHGHVFDFVKQMRETGKIHAADDGMISRPALHAGDLADVCVNLATGDVPSGVYNVTGGRWSWRQTTQMMGVKDPTFENRKTGWLGDSQGAGWTGEKLSRVCMDTWRRVSDGVRDSLNACGWAS